MKPQQLLPLVRRWLDAPQTIMLNCYCDPACVCGVAGVWVPGRRRKGSWIGGGVRAAPGRHRRLLRVASGAQPTSPFALLAIGKGPQSVLKNQGLRDLSHPCTSCCFRFPCDFIYRSTGTEQEGGVRSRIPLTCLPTRPPAPTAASSGSGFPAGLTRRVGLSAQASPGLTQSSAAPSTPTKSASPASPVPAKTRWVLLWPNRREGFMCFCSMLACLASIRCLGRRSAHSSVAQPGRIGHISSN